MGLGSASAFWLSLTDSGASDGSAHATTLEAVTFLPSARTTLPEAEPRPAPVSVTTDDFCPLNLASPAAVCAGSSHRAHARKLPWAGGQQFKGPFIDLPGFTVGGDRA
jgi:hypothetical protein